MGNSSSSFSGKKYSGIAERADFTSHGPKHLPTDWWQNAQDQCTVAACFINGVYVLEHDRREGRTGERALAPPWWKSFGYVLLKELINPDDGGIFGAIYQRTINLYAPEAPFMVVAFRGMVTDSDRITVMMIRDLACSSSFKVAMEHVHRIHMSDKTWLCGHSLGAAIGMLVGKIKAKDGIYLDTFLFNPPIFLRELRKVLYMSFWWMIPITSIASIIGEIAKRIAAASDAERKAFENLIKWQPRLLLNPGDFICSGYIQYYLQRDASLLTTGFDSRFDELHLPFVTPSANLILNMANKGPGEYHGIRQWWDDDLVLEYRLYGS